MSDVKFDVLNARVTFKNVPLHSLARFAFKDVAAATDAFKKTPVLKNVLSYKHQVELKFSPLVILKQMIQLMLEDLKEKV